MWASRRARAARTARIEISVRVKSLSHERAFAKRAREAEIDDLRRELKALETRSATTLERDRAAVRAVGAASERDCATSRARMSALDVKCDGARDVLREIQNANAQLASEVEAIRERAERVAAAKREARAQARLLEFRRVRSATTIQRAFRRWVANGRKRPKKRKTKTKRAKNTKSRGDGDVKKSTVRAGKTRRAA